MEKWRGLCEKFGKDRLWICIIGGLLLLVITYPLPTEENSENYTIIGEKNEKEGGNDIFTDGENDVQSSTDMNKTAAYGTTLEQKLSAILSQINGAGEVRVFITFADYGSKVVEKDTSYSRNNEEQTGADQEKISTVISENAEETVYTTNENGDEIPFVERVTVPKVEGVLVVTQGGNDIKVTNEMKDAIMALFGIEEHKIKVVKMKGEER